MISFSIFIASTTQITCPASTSSPVGDLDLEHRALHRADDGVAARAAGPAAPRARAGAGELGPGRLGVEHA